MQPDPNELMCYWLQGWPNFITYPKDDFPAILSIAKECARIARVSIDTDEGFKKISVAIIRIAEFCREKDPFYKQNLFKINQAIQSVLIEMQADKRSKKLAEEQRILSDQYLRDKLKRDQYDQLAEECRLKSKKWHDENWTDEMEKDYQQWLASGCKFPSKKVY
jgi:hypothetical protein